MASSLFPAGTRQWAAPAVTADPAASSHFRDRREEEVMKVLVAGATGAIGKQLLPRLTSAGHEVVGMTRSAAKAEAV